ncbi:glycogen/starch synthase [Galbibacter sp. EGI 63066]|uniref:glycogen synthase n=1 Tax=Galbibacter sp. EGI 63066 TaxID=2993559 RepID=UPI00224925D5|nr:glycogen/starch synthase [Galbibacter sp. EGI 63066]MCX2679532.1 glycogen/starch synthase [Galbibacter sp. EGI 63066]
MKSNFLFVCAENDAILNCKAGGMGDVVRDVPRQIATNDDLVHVVTPAYGRLHKNGEKIAVLKFLYRGLPQEAFLYEIPGKKSIDNIKHYVIDHPEIVSGDIADIYSNDPDQPFYTDACTFSLFCTAVATAIREGLFGELQIAHLHDWHTSLLLFLREYHPKFQELKKIRFVYSIHNLAIQGIRPFENNYSSLKAFYPDILIDKERLADTRYKDCINLMVLGIRLADAVHTVSPSYKEDIKKPSNPPDFIGGESLEEDLKNANIENRLFGILNGCNYKNYTLAKRNTLYKNSLKAIFKWLQEPGKKYKADFMAHTGSKIMHLMEDKPNFICTSVARLTEQKFFFYKNDPGLLMKLLDKLEEKNGVYIILGTGAPEYEELLRSVSYERENLIFINGQSEEVIDSLYLESNLYLMPSLFEPCGISQMLAMRNGQPCLVHATGGLKDTVSHLKSGFAFDGETLQEKTDNFIAVFGNAVDLYFEEKEIWEHICKTAKRQRFSWEDLVRKYYEQLYLLPYFQKNTFKPKKKWPGIKSDNVIFDK